MTPLISTAVLSLPLLLSIHTEVSTQDPGAQIDTPPPLTYEPDEGEANGKHIVLLAGDEEYRSEEGMPMLGRILAKHHGFRCTVLFSLDPETGMIDPENQTNVPGMEVLADADMMIVFFRFRELPDAQMKPFVDFVESGKPIMGLRTSTHAFQYKRNKESPYQPYTWRNQKWKDGFGKQILGETWVAHHGGHGSESTRGMIEDGQAGHPVLTGFEDVWGPTDVYTVKELPADATVLLRGAVLDGMTPESKPVENKKNQPMVPLVWVREIEMEGKPARRVVSSTIGASTDLNSAGLRRVLVNGCFWGLRMDVPEKAEVEIVGKYEPTPFGFGKYKRGVKPSDYALR